MFISANISLNDNYTTKILFNTLFLTFEDYQLYLWCIFYSETQANIKDNLWLDVVLNECFMIQCCSLMAELDSVMS